MRPPRQQHKEKCTTCGGSYECHGYLSENYDGIPPVVCSAYDVRRETECEECAEAPRCDNCGVKFKTLFRLPIGPGSDITGHYCADCAKDTV